MDATESEARRYLESLGFASIEYEPDGNVPPDFLCDGRVAVEVRRLSQNEKLPDGGFRSLDEVSIPFVARLHSVLSSLGPPQDGHSWFVFFRFRRPLNAKRKLVAAVKSALISFRDAGFREPSEIVVTENMTVELIRSSKVVEGCFFAPGGYSDQDSGGFLIHELRSNLELCIAEKSAKTARLRSKYPEWWLLLGDSISLGLRGLAEEISQGQLEIYHDWDKIVLIDPRDGRHGVEI